MIPVVIWYEYHTSFLQCTIGGLGITDSFTSTARSHSISVHATAILTAAIKNGSMMDLDSHMNAVLSARYHGFVSWDAATTMQLCTKNVV